MVSMSQTDLLLIDLQQDANGALLKDIRDRLTAMRGELRQAQDAGLDPERFAVSGKVMDAVNSAEQVVTEYWEFQHKQ